MKTLGFTLIFVALFSMVSVNQSSQTETNAIESNDDSEQWKLYEAKGYSVKIPQKWTIDMMGPFKDSLGRTHSNANVILESYTASLNITIYRYGFAIDTQEKIKEIIDYTKEDEDVYDMSETTESTAKIGDLTVKKIAYTYKYDGIESPYITTAYLYNNGKNSFVLNIDYAEEDEEIYANAIAVMLESFEVKAYQ